MTEEQTEAEPGSELVANPGTADQDDIRVAYQAAVQMVVYDGQLSWQVTGVFIPFAILMIAGAVFPSFIGTKDQLIIAFAGLAVSLAGVVMTCMFGSMVMRIRTYEEYWVVRAIQLESYLDDRVETLSGAAVLSHNGSIAVGRNTVLMRRTSAVRTKQMLKALILLFLITFTGLGGLNGWRLAGAVTECTAEALVEHAPTPSLAELPTPAPEAPALAR